VSPESPVEKDPLFPPGKRPIVKIIPDEILSLEMKKRGDRSSRGSTILSSAHNCREKTVIKTPENHLIQEFIRKRFDNFFHHLFFREIFLIAFELYIKMIPWSLK
jgi:hypothetical protein